MSPDGHMMLYASFNDSLVEEMHISWFGEGNKALYPDIRSLRYPKVTVIAQELINCEMSYLVTIVSTDARRTKAGLSWIFF